MRFACHSQQEERNIDFKVRLMNQWLCTWWFWMYGRDYVSRSSQLIVMEAHAKLPVLFWRVLCPVLVNSQIVLVFHQSGLVVGTVSACVVAFKRMKPWDFATVRWSRRTNKGGMSRYGQLVVFPVGSGFGRPNLNAFTQTPQYVACSHTSGIKCSSRTRSCQGLTTFWPPFLTTLCAVMAAFRDRHRQVCAEFVI